MTFQLLMQILAALAGFANTAFAQKVITCIETQSGLPAILTCITAATNQETPGTAPHAAGTAIISAINAAKP